MWKMNFVAEDGCTCGDTVAICTSFSSAIEFMYETFGVDKDTPILSHTVYDSGYGKVSMVCTRANCLITCIKCGM